MNALEEVQEKIRPVNVAMIISLVDTIRFENLLTFEALAKEIGITSHSIVRLRKGKSLPSFITISKYIKFLAKYGYRVKLVQDFKE